MSSQYNLGKYLKNLAKCTLIAIMDLQSLKVGKDGFGEKMLMANLE